MKKRARYYVTSYEWPQLEPAKIYKTLGPLNGSGVHSRGAVELPVELVERYEATRKEFAKLIRAVERASDV